MKVSEVMTKNPIKAEAPGSRSKVLRLLVQHNITGVPVVKEGTKRYVGFVSRQDIFSKPDVEQLALIVNKEHPCVKSKDDLRLAAKILVEKELHHLPVVEKKNLVGILTPTDLLVIVEKENYKDTVESYVRRPCIPIYENTPLTIVAAMIKITNAYAFPVLDDDSRLSGIVTDRDIFNLSVVDGSTAISDLGSGEDEDVWTWEGMRNIMKLYYEVSKITLPKIPVKEIMVKDPVTVFRKTTISEAARIMRKNDFGQLPIRNSDDRLIAMVDELDVISCLIR
ncbi:MAG: CBS domain-containing protein [Methanomassiliicoccales archaeon]|nr:MAG: CBS domain-containing protein [Methanomassiliicoccales archaeon]